MRTSDQPDKNPAQCFLSPGVLAHQNVEADDRPRLVYDLRIDGASSERFYADVASFSTRVLAEVNLRAAPLVEEYSQYVTGCLRELPRSRGEYAVEFLTVGMVLRLYGDMAAATPGWVMDLARELYSVRRSSRALKPAADFLRAGLFQLFMRRHISREDGAVSESAGPPAMRRGYADLPRLMEWLAATGEFEQEWRRLDNWRSYWSQLPAEDAAKWVGVALELFDWFAREGEAALGRYTVGVIHFLENAYAMRYWREDLIFCGRIPAEYHLGMVAAEVMNEGLREDFRSRPRKVVLVPGCMRGVRSATCQAVTKGLDISCAGCDPDCAINRITRRMRYEAIEVYIVPHATGFSRWLERWQSDPKVGVAAVACMMNILPGGYEMRARRIASQCVPLDYPGCEKHWREDPVATSVNEQRLVQLVTSTN